MWMIEKEDHLIAAIMGIIVLAIGIGAGYLFYASPEGVKGIAWLFPVICVFGGSHILFEVLDQPRFSVAALRIAIICLLLIFHWYAFFEPDIQCKRTIAFFKIITFSKKAGELECRIVLIGAVFFFDLILLILPLPSMAIWIGRA